MNEIEEVKKELIKKAIEKIDEPWKNLTVKDVRKDFPSINIGKTKTISNIAYSLWKLEKREE